MNVLVVDDLAIDRRRLRSLLETANHAVLEAGDGVEALHVLEQEPVDAVISDVLMPHMDGFRLCLEVRKSERLRALPFIIHTGTFDSAHNLMRAHDVGADRCIAKPAPRAAVIEALNNACRKAANRGCTSAGTPDEVGIIKQHNASLIAKLENKNEELEQRSAELRAMHDQLRNLLAHSPAVLYRHEIKDGKPVPVFVSENAVTLLGFTAEESLRPGWWEAHLHPDDREAGAVSLSCRMALELGSSLVEYRLQRSDGSYLWVEDRKRVVRDAAGQPREFVGSWTDTTAQRQAEETVRKASGGAIRNQQRNNVIELAVLGAAIAVVYLLSGLYHGFESFVQWVTVNESEQLHQVLFTMAFAFVGFTIVAFRRWKQYETALAAREEVQKALRLLHGELDVRVKQRTAELVRANDALRAEVAERKQAEAALRASEERFRQLAENINEVFWILDPASQRVLYVSPAYDRVWGRSRESLLANGREWFDAVHPDDRARVAANGWNRPIAEPCGHTYRIVQPNASVRWIHDRAFPIRNSDGQVYRVVGVAADVTEQRKLEEQFRQAQKMEAVGTLAGGIAHDFNNILTAIVGYTDMARMALSDNPAICANLDNVMHGANRAVDLVRRILAFSRRQPEQVRKPLQLERVVTEALKLLRATIPTTVEFEISLARDLPNVLADGTQIHQVIMNLATNAWHAMKERPGRLTVQLERCEVDAEHAQTQPDLRPGRYVRLSVGDNGHGMDQLTVSRIFEPFFTTKAPGEGSGLGLAVVHGIMRSHEGVITVHSQPGEGTTFELYFPAHDGEAAEVAAPATSRVCGHGERILYLDDDALIAQLGEKSLRKLGYEVEFHTRVVDALDAVKTDPRRFAAVITDQTMPVMTGMDVARRMLEIRPELPVILTTGHLAELTVEQVQAVGIRQVLHKPYTIEALAAAVHGAISSK